jgi:hypothetical protein
MIRSQPAGLLAFEEKRTLRMQWEISGNHSTQALVLDSKALGQIAILSSLVARNATFLLALI